MESDVTQFLSLGYRTDVDGTDLSSPDGRESYQIKFTGRGIRDLRDATLRLATFCARHPNVERGYLLASLIRVSASRIKAEWGLIKQVLLPELGARMQVVAVVDGTEVVEPAHLRSTPVIDWFLEMGRKASVPPESRSTFSEEDSFTARNPLGVTWKHLEVEKVLVHRWLLGEGSIAVGTLSRQVGC